jgi:hypothetical protein
LKGCGWILMASPSRRNSPHGARRHVRDEQRAGHLHRNRRADGWRDDVYLDRHVGTRFAGTVRRDRNFTATVTVGPDSGGQTYSERLEGRFTATGFSATLGVDVTPRNCRFTRSWTATKQGSPNVLP